MIVAVDEGDKMELITSFPLIYFCVLREAFTVIMSQDKKFVSMETFEGIFKVAFLS